MWLISLKRSLIIKSQYLCASGYWAKIKNKMLISWNCHKIIAADLSVIYFKTDFQADHDQINKVTISHLVPKDALTRQTNKSRIESRRRRRKIQDPAAMMSSTQCMMGADSPDNVWLSLCHHFSIRACRSSHCSCCQREAKTALGWGLDRGRRGSSYSALHYRPS